MKTWNPVLPVCGLMLLVNACTKQGLITTQKSDSSTVDVTATSATSSSTRVEAEDYTAMSGVQTEDCREGGKDVGYISVGDWMDYTITVNTAGTHTLSFRVAGPKSTLQVQKSDGTVLANVTLPGTTSGQVYTTVTTTVQLSAGKQTIRIYATSAAWNFNWWEFTDAAGGGVIKPDSTAGTGQNLTLYSAFESTTDFAKWSEEICRPSALTISSAVPARKGNSSARFEFAKSDVTTYNGYIRAEIHQDSPPEAENWYGFSMYLPTDFVSDPMAEKFAQWHEIPDWDLGETWRSPPISLGIQNDRYNLQVLWAAAPVNTNNTKDGEKDIDLGPVTDKGKWADWVVHIKFSYKSDGILEIWKNKVKIYSLYGPNSFNDENFPYFKLGIYKWGWNGWASYSPESKRVLYMDEVRIGNSKSSLNEVSPQ